MKRSRFSDEQIIAIVKEREDGRLRDECLNETLFTSLAHARSILAAWKHCPPSALMAQICGCDLRRIGASSQ